MSPYFFVAGLALFTLALSAPGGAIAKGSITAGEPAPFDQMRSLGDVIRDSKNGAVHVIYVHGMRAEKPGQAGAFISRL